MNKSLLPPNATALDHAAEAIVVKATDAIELPHRSLWNADACPVNLLPWLAWQVGVEGWRSEWTEAVKRARIKASIRIHRQKGTVKAVKDAVRSFGAQIAVREWWETTPKGTPHTFELVLTVPDSGTTGTVATEDFINDVIDEVDRTKPLRSHFTFVLGLNAKASPAMACVGRPVVFSRLDMDIN